MASGQVSTRPQQRKPSRPATTSEQTTKDEPSRINIDDHYSANRELSKAQRLHKPQTERLALARCSIPFVLD
jgi:hypothetical protein